MSLEFLREVEVPTSVFSCRKLRYLALRNFRLENMPDSFARFDFLTKLCLNYTYLNDMTFQRMLDLCPVLKILAVGNCHGLQRVNIRFNRHHFLNLDIPPSHHRIDRIREITANCPRLESLAIEVLYHVEKMEFDLPQCLRLSIVVPRLEPFENLTSLTEMTSFRRILCEGLGEEIEGTD
ncbi:hypothetical protein SUGI_0728730 [Cryptomeria japonica]|nr:hypothetical protein SUGI_0728730 [Cryptomeria japonica]